MKEFREFIARGNVMDLAVGVIIGGAFGLIVKSLTDDIIMQYLELHSSQIMPPASAGVSLTVPAPPMAFR